MAKVTFDPNAWFLEIESEQLSLVSKNGKGVIVISETQNTNIFEIVAEDLALATEVEVSK